MKQFIELMKDGRAMLEKIPQITQTWTLRLGQIMPETQHSLSQ